MFWYDRQLIMTSVLRSSGVVASFRSTRVRWGILLALVVAGGWTAGVSAQQEGAAAPRTPPLALTPAEYNNTIADLLGFPRDGDLWPQRSALADRLSPRRAASKGVFAPPPPPAAWPWRFPSEPGSEGFEGIAQGQDPSSYQVEELHLAAMHFASFALVSPTFFTCTDWTASAGGRAGDLRLVQHRALRPARLSTPAARQRTRPARGILAGESGRRSA